MPEFPEQSMEQIIRHDGRYPPEAYGFLHDGLTQAAMEAYGESTEGAESERRHVTGQQICGALRVQAVERWGMLARTVLVKWNIHETIDFGEMVYLLIEHNHMRKTEEDSIDDFRDVYDFDEAFPIEGKFELKE